MMQNAFVIHCMKDMTIVMGSNANNLQLKAIQRDNILLIQFSLKKIKTIIIKIKTLGAYKFFKTYTLTTIWCNMICNTTLPHHFSIKEPFRQLYRKKNLRRRTGERRKFSNWILVSCQPHSFTSARKTTTIKIRLKRENKKAPFPAVA